MITLGQKVRDKITGFTGIATAHVKYLTGCDQIGVTPAVNSESKLPDGAYFDLSRLEVLEDKPVLERTNNDRGGPNRDCPKR